MTDTAAPQPAVSELVERVKRDLLRGKAFGINCGCVAVADVEALVSALSPKLDAPITTRNEDHCFTETINEDIPIVARELDGRVDILLDVETRRIVGYRVYDATVSANLPTPVAHDIVHAMDIPEILNSHTPQLLSREEKLIWVLGDLMNAVENFFGAENPKRLGHINSAAISIIDKCWPPLPAPAKGGVK